MKKRIKKKLLKKNCKYCTKSERLYWCPNYDYSVREVYVELDGSLTVDTNMLDENSGCNFKINFCPMCGKKLEM